MTATPRRVLVLGATGSIGRQTLEIIRRNPDRFVVAGLSAGTNREQLTTLAQEFRLDDSCTALGAGDAELLTNDIEADVVVNGITGSAGLGSTIAALQTGRTLALANKESLIVGAPLVRKLAQPGQIVPVDSEHSAIAQCLASGRREEISRIVLTASGGPFRGRARSELRDVTPQDALAHPTWDMGRVVTTNSATMMNKGLEVIEAHVLFDIPFDQIDVVVHPQSIIHSMVEYVDGATMAQVSMPDMALPIALGLSWPTRIPNAVTPMDWSKAQTWTFEPLDDDAFPAVKLAKQVGAAGGEYPAVFNAANEVLVDAFHDGEIPFLGIVDTVRAVVEDWREEDGQVTRESLHAAELWARTAARQRIQA